MKAHKYSSLGDLDTVDKRPGRNVRILVVCAGGEVRPLDEEILWVAGKSVAVKKGLMFGRQDEGEGARLACVTFA